MGVLTSSAANVSYVLLLIGGLNWLTTGVRLVIGETGTEDTLIVPDLLSWGGHTLQVVIYFTVGVASLALLALLVLGYWVRPGSALILCV